MLQLFGILCLYNLILHILGIHTLEITGEVTCSLIRSQIFGHREEQFINYTTTTQYHGLALISVKEKSLIILSNNIKCYHIIIINNNIFLFNHLKFFYYYIQMM